MRRNLWELAESFRIAGSALVANKARGILTTLGIVIGIVAVATTMTAANGLSNNFKESVAVLGSDVLYVSRFPWVMQGRFFNFRNRSRLTMKDVDKLERQLDAARAINPTIQTNRPVKYRANTLGEVDVIGTTDQQVMMSTALPEFGRFLTGVDVQYKKRVCVIGSEIRDKLFDKADPLNKDLRIGRSDFRVVGIMEKQGGAGFFGGPNFDRQIYVPITTFMKSFGSANRDFNIAVKAPSAAGLEDFEFEVRGAMRKIRKLGPTEDDDFAINKMDSLVAMFNNVMGVVVLIGAVITGISLFVGGIGVMNIMFVSVTERTREIGIRKAIGAKRRTILTQFLLESSAICLVGGVLGLAFAFAATAAINRLLMPASMSLPIVFAGLVVSILVGMLSGVVPAYRASRLDPIDALRYE